MTERLDKLKKELIVTHIQKQRWRGEKPKNSELQHMIQKMPKLYQALFEVGVPLETVDIINLFSLYARLHHDNIRLNKVQQIITQGVDEETKHTRLLELDYITNYFYQSENIIMSFAFLMLAYNIQYKDWKPII